MRSNDTYNILDDHDERPRRGFWDKDDDFHRRRRNKTLPNSGLGIASLVIGLVVGAVDFMSLVVAGILSEKQGAQFDDSKQAIAIWLVLLVGFLASLIGGALAIIGLVQVNRAKGYGIAGLVVNSLLVLGMLGLIVIALLAG
ncbi:MAG TPA: hypothetical protein VKS79_06080 [Gemmataceae bacterium]|nr:hypothetical protein [Gemmataceae bacterium]